MFTQKTLACFAGLFYASTSFAATLVDLTQQDFKRPKSAAYQLKSLGKVVDKSGNTHIRYEQLYQDIPVYGYHVLEHQYQPTVQARGLHLRAFSGTYVQDIAQDLPELRTVTTDPLATLQSLKMAYTKQQGLPYEKFIFDNESARTVIFINPKDEAILSYEVNFYADHLEGGMPSRPHYLVEAATGHILKKWDGLAFNQIGKGPGGNERIGFYTYGQDKPAMDITRQRGTCSLNNEAGKTVHANNLRKQESVAYAYNCRRSLVQNNDAINGAASPLNDAHYFIDVLVQFYQDNYGTAPLPFPLVMRAHYGKSYANAFWNGSSMTYGDGNAELYPFVVLDIAAHEIAHGVTEQHSKLVYDGQSGGMNEAFSDMASRAVEYFVYGSHDWYLGGDIFKDPSILALRFMNNPPQDGASLDHLSQYADGIDVHHTSGIYNKAFFHLATTSGWNTAQAFDVMYYANVGYWQPNTSFVQGAWDVVQATAANGHNVDDVIHAFKQVGINCDKIAGRCE